MFIGRLEGDHDWNIGFSYSRNWSIDPCNSRARVLKVWCFRFNIIPIKGQTSMEWDFNGFYWKKEFDIPFTLKHAKVFMTSLCYAKTQDDAGQEKKEISI